MGATTVTVSNLKGIEELSFEIPDEPGVYLLVGKNGCGKSSLLTCLDRIGNNQAFSVGFPFVTANGVDAYRGACISYERDGKTLAFTRGLKRWAPKPKSGTQDFLLSLGYSGTFYAKADSGRLRTRRDDIEPGKLLDAPAELKSCLRDVFEDGRFDNLMLLENKNGRRWFKYFYVLQKGEGDYYSEKSFSSGELAVLRLLDELVTIKKNTLVLVDEAELALHPQIQIKLYDLLVRLSFERQLTTIVSTHSVTLVKTCPKERLILIENGQAVTPCYPSLALEAIDEYREVVTDFMLFFEDEMAEDCFRAMHACLKDLDKLSSDASFSTAPVGGFVQTATLAVNVKRRFPKYTVVKAVLDHDFLETRCNKSFASLCREHRNSINDLGFTPEVQLIDTANECLSDLDKRCRSEFGVSLSDVMRSEEYRDISSTNPRSEAKKKFEFIVDQMRQGVRCKDVVRIKLIEIIVSLFDESIMRKSVGSVLSTHGLKNEDLDLVEKGSS